MWKMAWHKANRDSNNVESREDSQNDGEERCQNSSSCASLNEENPPTREWSDGSRQTRGMTLMKHLIALEAFRDSLDNCWTGGKYIEKEANERNTIIINQRKQKVM